MPTPLRITARLVATSLVATLCIAAARADVQRPLTLTAGAGVNFDDNLFRLSPGQSPPSSLGSTSRSDLYWNAFLNGQSYLHIGRQLLHADLGLTLARYARYSFLNYQALNGLAADEWKIGNLFSGTLSYEQRQSQSSFTDVRNFEKNLNTVRTASSENEAWLQPDWHLTAGFAATTVDNSNASLSSSKLQENAFDVGIKYLTYQENYLRLWWREARGRYPNAEFVAGSLVDNRYDQTDIALEYYQAPTGSSRLNARLAYTRRRYPELPQRDYSGPTGRIGWDYMISGKVGFNLLFRREIGAYTDIVTNYIVTEAVSIAPYWRVTNKVRVDASVERQRRDYRGEPQFTATNQPLERDYLTLFQLSATYEATRRWTFATGWQHSSRSSNLDGLSFSDQTVYLTVQYKWD
jgi:exopolysaccharide biosynthesis operon protein EpsL